MSGRTTVIVPCHGEGGLLAAAIDSALAEPVAEVIVVDDGSRDTATAAVLANRARQARVRVIHQDNAGPAAAFNRGLRDVTTPFAFKLDADDLIAPGAVTALEAALDAAPHAGFACGQLELFGAQEGILRIPPFDAWRLTYMNAWTGCGLYRTAALRAIGGYRHAASGEDWHTLGALVEAGYGVTVTENVVYRYRKHPHAGRRSSRSLREYPRLVEEFIATHPQLIARRAALRATSSVPRPARPLLIMRHHLQRHMPTWLAHMLLSARWRLRIGRGAR